MLQRILVPLDGSDLAERALVYAVPLAKQSGAAVLVLRAAMSHTLPGVDTRERQSGAIDEAQEYLDRVVTDLRARDLVCEAVVRYGHPAECITESARTRGADLVVMATHGRTGPGRWIFGSIAEAVVASSPVPVLVQRAWQPLIGDTLLAERPTIGVPLDGSSFAEAAIEPAAALAEDLNGRLVLLSVQDSPAEIREAWEYLTRLNYAVGTRHPTVSVQCEVRNGPPPEGIESAVAQLDLALIVMSTHGRTGVLRSTLGSFAGKLLEESDVPVVLVRPRPFEADEQAASPAAAATA